MVNWITETGALWSAIITHSFLEGMKPLQYRINMTNQQDRQSQWPRGLRRRSSAARLLRLWVWIPRGAWMFVCCECCVLSGRGFCDGLITRPEESYRQWRVVVCDQETSKTRRLKPATGLCKIHPLWVVKPGKQINRIFEWYWKHINLR